MSVSCRQPIRPFNRFAASLPVPVALLRSPSIPAPVRQPHSWVQHHVGFGRASSVRRGITRNGRDEPCGIGECAGRGQKIDDWLRQKRPPRFQPRRPPMSTPMDLRGALKAVRFEKGWTQATLARRLSIRPETVCRWERGKSRPRPTHVRALAHMAARPEAFRLRKEGDVTQVRFDAIRARGATRPPTPGSNKHRRLDAKMVGVLRALRPVRSQRRARAGWFN